MSFLNRAARYFTSGMELASTICTPGAVSVMGRRRARPAGREVELLQIHGFQRHIGVGAELLEKRRSALLIRVDTGIPNASAMFESVWWLRKARRLSLYSNDSARLPCKKKSPGQNRRLSFYRAQFTASSHARRGEISATFLSDAALKIGEHHQPCRESRYFLIALHWR